MAAAGSGRAAGSSHILFDVGNIFVLVLKRTVNYLVGDWDAADTLGVIMAIKMIVVYLIFNVDWSYWF